MRAQELRLDILEVPLRTAMASAAGAWGAVRLGLLRLVTDDGLEGLAEVVLAASDDAGADLGGTSLDVRCAGLAGLDLEDEDAVRARLTRIAASEGRGAAEDGPLVRALTSALATAIFTLRARAAERSVAEHLCRGASGAAAQRFPACPPAADVRVNALLGIGEPDAVAHEARALVEAGWSCLKLKAGAEAPGSVRARVAAVRAAVGPMVALRLDLNGTLDEASAAVLLDQLAPLALDYVEQPVPASAGPGALARLRRRGSVPIAADEAVTGVAAVQELARIGAVDAVVVKPARVGGLEAAARIVESALFADIRVTIATMVESGVGVAGALHLAAAVPGGAHGLSTAGLLASDLVGGSLVPRHGRLAVPSGPGLGVEVDPEAVERFRVSPPMRCQVARA